MKGAIKWLKRTLVIVICTVILAFIFVILLISPIARNLIEKYDVKYTGRQITTSWVYINPFTGFVHLSNLKIYESGNLPGITNSDSVAFSAKGVNAKFTLYKLLSKTIEINKLELDEPNGRIIQNKEEFNFTDLIKKFTPKKSTKTPSPIHFNILGIEIKNATFSYFEQEIPVRYFIREVNFSSAGKHWNTDTIAVRFSFLSGTGTGSAKGNFTINFKNMDFRLATIIHQFDLKFIEQYLKVLSNYGHFSASLDADLKASGNLRDQENLHAAGQLALKNFHFGKDPMDDYVSFNKLVVNIIELSPKNHQYDFDSVSLTNPVAKYERYDSLDNVQRMFGKNGRNLSSAKADGTRFNLVLKIAEYVKAMAKNFFHSNYKINRLAIYNGDLKFNDFSLTEKFSVQVKPFFLAADSINKTHQRVNATLTSSIQPYGSLSLALSINPRDSGDFDMVYHLHQLPATLFNPYLVTYSSFPLDRGSLEFNGTWNVRNGFIKSVNHLLVIDPRVTKRVRNKDTKWLPVPLIMFFLRERGNVIDYEIPISGNLRNPKFQWKDVILDLLGNIFVKPPTTPYRMQVNNIEHEIENSITLRWDRRQSALPSNEKIFISKMTDFLVHHPEASMEVYPYPYEEKEKESIAFFEAKKKYYLLKNNPGSSSLSKEDSSKVDKMSVKDNSFVQYLNKTIKDTLLFTIQDKCNKWLSVEEISAKFQRLNRERKAAFMLDFKNKKVEGRVKFLAAENKVPYNGFSYYKIVYKGELPKSLIKAYELMNRLNDEAPRKRFEKDRKKNKSVNHVI